MLQPEPFRGSGCNTLSHTGLASRFGLQHIITLGLGKRQYTEKNVISSELYSKQFQIFWILRPMAKKYFAVFILCARCLNSMITLQ